MCGVAGVYALTDRPPDPAWGRLLVDCLKHRGPDGDGVYSDRRIVLAHTRLAIIDLSEGGAQPMRSADDRFVIAQNGEIYNHAELRPALERDGVRLRSASDTEVLLESLALRGSQALAALHGMFAFALYDRETGDLLLARDRLGKKPLLYVKTPEFLAFASEARALLRLPFVRARLDRAALLHYLQLLYVPSPFTLIEGVRKLEPATWLRFSGADPAREPAGERYWRLPEPDPRQRADADWLGRLDELFLEATRLRTVSDVPIGVYLSGGMDSNAVLERLRRASHRPIRAYTVGFAGLPDERPLAREGARAYADEHLELVLDHDLSADIPDALRCFGEPLGDSAVVTTFAISRAAARHVKVILNGDGGDELFGGYPRYPFARRADWAASLPGGLALLGRRYAGRVASEPVFATLRARRPDAAARALGSVTSDAQAADLLRPELLCAHPLAPPAIRTGRDAELTGALFAWDTGVYLPDDLLVKVDVASMAHAIENRSPLLDHRLFEHVALLPPSRRAHPLQTKPLLRRLVRGRVPPGVLSAPKQGFQLPLEVWLHGPLRGWLDGLLADPVATGALYREGAMARALAGFHARHSDELAGYRLWGLAALEFWAREFGVEVGG